MSNEALSEVRGLIISAINQHLAPIRLLITPANKDNNTIKQTWLGLKRYALLNAAGVY